MAEVGGTIVGTIHDYNADISDCDSLQLSTTTQKIHYGLLSSSYRELSGILDNTSLSATTTAPTIFRFKTAFLVFFCTTTSAFCQQWVIPVQRHTWHDSPKWQCSAVARSTAPPVKVLFLMFRVYLCNLFSWFRIFKYLVEAPFSPFFANTRLVILVFQARLCCVQYRYRTAGLG